jgi:hypothetical protein
MYAEFDERIQDSMTGYVDQVLAPSVNSRCEQVT